MRKPVSVSYLRVLRRAQLNRAIKLAFVYRNIAKEFNWKMNFKTPTMSVPIYLEVFSYIWDGKLYAVTQEHLFTHLR